MGKSCPTLFDVRISRIGRNSNYSRLTGTASPLYLIGLLWQVVVEFADIILLFFLAWLVAFVLEPLVGTLVEGRLPRLAAIGLTYVTLLVWLILGVILLVPALSLQIVEVARNLPAYVEQTTTVLTAVQARKVTTARAGPSRRARRARERRWSTPGSSPSDSPILPTATGSMAPLPKLSVCGEAT